MTPLVDTSCAHGLDDTATAKLGEAIAASLSDPTLDVRVAAIDALGRILATRMLPRLERRSRALQRVVAACELDPDAHEARCNDAALEQHALERALDDLRSAPSHG